LQSTAIGSSFQLALSIQLGVTGLSFIALVALYVTAYLEFVASGWGELKGYRAILQGGVVKKWWVMACMGGVYCLLLYFY